MTTAIRAACLFIALLPLPALASPLEQAVDRAKATFNWSAKQLSAEDQAWVNQTWPTVPFEQTPYTYSFAEIRAKWPTLMRGMQLQFPSADYLRTRYLKFPDLLQSLRYSDGSWQQHSYNVLEVWQAFFRGDFQRASRLGEKYGGYAEVPAVLSEIVAAVYLMPTLEQKQALLRDAILRIEHYAQQFPYVPGQREFRNDYAMLRLGFAYAVGRLAEDESVPKLLASNHPVIAMNAITELLAVMPHHPMGLALAGGVDANVIRRVGKLIGNLGLGVEAFDAKHAFERATSLVPNMAILRYEYANSLLYIHGRSAWPKAKKQLQMAVAGQPLMAMEALDEAYACKHLALLESWAATQQSYRDFDDQQRARRQDNDINGYWVGKTQLERLHQRQRQTARNAPH